MGLFGQRFAALAAVAVTLAVSGCGGESSSPAFPTVQAARTYELADFEPAGSVRPNVPTTVSFTIEQPNGEPLTDYQTGDGPHTGVHLIFVRDDLSELVHHHPPIGEGGQVSEQVTLPSPGLWRLVVDAYPNPATSEQRNFQLFEDVSVQGVVVQQEEPPPFEPTVTLDGYTVTMDGPPTLAAVEAAFLTITVKDPQGRPAEFTPWFGALAHAIFFRADSLDYVHTHVCEPGATGCTSSLGGAQVSGTESAPGTLRVGVLVPAPGIWRLFLQCKVDGRVLTAPFTLTVE